MRQLVLNYVRVTQMHFVAFCAVAKMIVQFTTLVGGKLADDRKVVCGISFGFADNAHKVNSYRTSRASVADTVTFVDK